jgi:hypothetical protein
VPDRERELEAYAQVMHALDVPNTPLVRPSFSGIEAYITKLGEEGKPIPDALKHVRLVDRFTITTRARGGVDLDRLADIVYEQHNSCLEDSQAQDHYLNNDNPF